HLEGPVRTLFGWYVFEVLRVIPPDRPSLADAREEIRRMLQERRERAALAAFNERLEAEYGLKTACADEFRVARCG
ncbi:MAG: peptidylprolyl isomerase, partial [Thermoleophilaceae bacterium]